MALGLQYIPEKSSITGFWDLLPGGFLPPNRRLGHKKNNASPDPKICLREFSSSSHQPGNRSYGFIRAFDPSRLRWGDIKKPTNWLQGGKLDWIVTKTNQHLEIFGKINSSHKPAHRYPLQLYSLAMGKRNSYQGVTLWDAVRQWKGGTLEACTTWGRWTLKIMLFKEAHTKVHATWVFFFFFFLFAHGMQNFLGQGSNPCHSSDNVGSFTTRPPGNTLWFCLSEVPGEATAGKIGIGAACGCGAWLGEFSGMMGIFCNLIRDLDYTDVCVHLNSPNITVEKWVSVITHVNVTPKRKKKKKYWTNDACAEVWGRRTVRSASWCEMLWKTKMN